MGLSIFSCAYMSSVYLLWWNAYSNLFPIVGWGLLSFLLLNVENSPYILCTIPLSDMEFVIVLAKSVVCLFLQYFYSKNWKGKLNTLRLSPNSSSLEWALSLNKLDHPPPHGHSGIMSSLSLKSVALWNNHDSPTLTLQEQSFLELLRL